MIHLANLAADLEAFERDGWALTLDPDGPVLVATITDAPMATRLAMSVVPLGPHGAAATVVALDLDEGGNPTAERLLATSSFTADSPSGLALWASALLTIADSAIADFASAPRN